MNELIKGWWNMVKGWFSSVPTVASPVPVEESELKVGMHIPRKLQSPAEFYDIIRRFKLFGPVFSNTELAGCEAILKDCGNAGWPISWTAYALATAYHETAGTMQPIKEYGGYSYYMRLYDVSGQNPTRARKMGNTKIGDGARYCGRGYVQLTWKVNYQKAKDKLGLDFVGNPDLALVADYAGDIMIRGMKEGWFTGVKLSTYLPLDNSKATERAFYNCRRIINGTDKATIIANYALDFQEALEEGRWRQ